MPQARTLAFLASLAEDQWGLFTRQQAAAAGLAWTTLSRLAAGGAAERVAHGVYRLRGSPPADDLALRAAWLQLAPEAPAWERGPETGARRRSGSTIRTVPSGLTYAARPRRFRRLLVYLLGPRSTEGPRHSWAFSFPSRYQTSGSPAGMTRPTRGAIVCGVKVGPVAALGRAVDRSGATRTVCTTPRVR
jgi:Transcriptional regulator, AbiEi antitoxin